MAPTITMPWIELAADISGVCSVAGTLLMTSIPTSRLSTKMVRSVSRTLDTRATFRVVACGQRGHPGVDHPAVVRDHHAGLDLVLRVDGQAAVAGHVQQQRRHVPRVGG